MRDRTRYLLLILFLAVAQSASAQTFFLAQLTPAQEGGEVTSEAAGTAALVLTSEGLRYFVTVDGLTGDIAAAHFHAAAIGASGGPVRTITGDFEAGSASGTWTSSDAEPLTDELLADLLAGRLYLNIHTSQNPGGEIRGQVLPVSGTGFTAALTPEQETGEVSSTAIGTAFVQLTDAGVLFHVTVNGLTGDIAAAHFHQGEAGASGGPVRTITGDFEGPTAFGLWRPSDGEPLTDELIEALLLGQLYLNVHTSQNPGGEIRGQVELASGWGFRALLDPDQENAGVTSGATGTAVLTLTEAGLVYRVTVTGLESDFASAHFHLGAPGSAGPPVRTISDDFEGATATGVWRPGDDEPLTDDLIRSLLAGDLYLNVHTAAHPGGEIRGQVLADEGTTLGAALTAAQAGTQESATGSGTGVFTLTEEGLEYQVTVDSLTGDLAAAHFHEAAAGASGGVVRTIAFEGNTASGIWTASDDEPLTEELLETLLLGGLYVNIHTPEHPAGEIRGQVQLAEGASLAAFLTNEQETAEVTQEGSGTAAMTLTDAGLVYRATVTGLSGEITGAHIHAAPAGEDGSVIHGLTFADGSAAGVWREGEANGLADDARTMLLTGGAYLNVHTAANAGGEIRGQIHPASGIGAATQLDPEQEVEVVESEASGTALALLTQQGLLYHLTYTGLSGEFTGAHFHAGGLGQGGPVVHGIGEAFTGATAAGVWGTEAPIEAEHLDALLGGGLYLNVHSSAYAAGEIRGQLLAGGVVATAIEQIGSEVPDQLALAQNYPNPFNPVTTISFTLPQSTRAVLAVYNVLGQRVATLVDGTLPAGEFRVAFDGQGLPSGVYQYRLEADGVSQTRAMLLMK